MSTEKVLEFTSGEASPSLELLSQQYSLMEHAIRAKLIESFQSISEDVLPIVSELAKLLEKSLRNSKTSSAYLQAFSDARSIQELTIDIEKLMLCYHRIIVGRDWLRNESANGTGPTLVKG